VAATIVALTVVCLAMAGSTILAYSMDIRFSVGDEYMISSLSSSSNNVTASSFTTSTTAALSPSSLPTYVVGFGTLLLVWTGAGGSLWHRVGERGAWALSPTLAGHCDYSVTLM
jgi:hypothetical protein